MAYKRQLKPPGTYLQITVSDNGIGMDDATLRHIFEPYFTTKVTGSGLGLAATIGIIDRYRGGIRVASEPTIGSTFTLIFPISTDTTYFSSWPAIAP